MEDENTNPATTALIQIRPLGIKDDNEGWYTIPTPSSYQYDRSDYDAEEGSYRDITGTMTRQRITTKVKLTLSWNSAALAATDISKLLQAVKPLFFEVRYFDPYEGGMTTTTMYVGDRSLDMYSFINGKPVWRTIAFNLIEK